MTLRDANLEEVQNFMCCFSRRCSSYYLPLWSIGRFPTKRNHYFRCATVLVRRILHHQVPLVQRLTLRLSRIRFVRQRTIDLIDLILFTARRLGEIFALHPNDTVDFRLLWIVHQQCHVFVAANVNGVELDQADEGENFVDEGER
jgi:hypothetical protein